MSETAPGAGSQESQGAPPHDDRLMPMQDSPPSAPPPAQAPSPSAPPGSSPYGPPPLPGMPVPRPVPKARRRGPGVGLIIGILVVLLLGGAGAAYWLLLSPHRYVGTYELKTVTWMGRTVDMDELAKYMGAFMGLGGAGSTPPKVEVLLVLKGNGTGELQDKTPAGGGMFGGPKDTTVKWKAVKKGIEVAVSSGSGQSYTLTGKLTGKELALSAQQASSGMTLIKR